MAQRIRNLTNQTFSRLTVKSCLGRYGKNTVWICECVCGNIATKNSASLVSGSVKSCGCLAKIAANARPKRFAPKQSRQPIYNLLAEAKRRAREKKLAFTIARQDIIIPIACPILGIPLFHGKGNACDNSPTLDRIIPAIGYIPGNVAVISKRANTIKSFGTAEEHLAIAAYIQKHAG